MKAMKFSCPDCHKPVTLEVFLVDEEKGDITCVGVCPNCREQVHFKLDAIIARLYGDNYVKGSERGQ